MKYPVKFTLTEMLVVIAIISILAALLMPGLQHSVNSARALSCMNNMRLTTFALMTYADENRGWIYAGYTNLFSDWNAPLVGGGGVYKFPAQSGMTEITKCPINPKGKYGWNQSFYYDLPLSARYVHNVAPNPANYCFLRLTRVKSPAKAMWMADCRNTKEYCVSNNKEISPQVAMWSPVNWLPTATRGIWLGHNNRANMAFADGHVSGCTANDLYERGVRKMIMENWDLLDM